MLLINIKSLYLSFLSILSDLEDCGTNEKLSRVLVGTEVGLWPWMGSIGLYDSDQKWVHKCGATLITSRHGLTAAHCALDRT